MYDIIVGRNESDKKKFGMNGTIFLGKHYIKMGRVTTLSGNIYLDVARSHVFFVCGKRGGGKSYTMGVIAEGMADLPEEIRQNLCFILLDTMGIYWTMKYPNRKDELLLEEWGLKAKPCNVKIYTPFQYFKTYKEQGIPTDAPFSIKPSDLNERDWLLTFDLKENEPMGILIEKVVHDLKKKKKDFGIKDIMDAVKNDESSEKSVRDAVINRLLSTDAWGVFSNEGTPLTDLVKGGQVTVLDVSCYATTPGGGWNVKNLIIGLIAQRLFLERMVSRKNEEFQEIHSTMHYFGEEKKEGGKLDFPLVWLVIDEAHEFLPREGKTSATDALVTIMREGRQPGISLMLATQQPGKIHTDVMTQSDVFLSHRITARLDVDSLAGLMQSYMREGLDVQLDSLPRTRGAALMFDDTNERLYQMQVRPRFTWHGGEAPMAVPKKKEGI